MKIINEVKDEILGKLVCFANEELEPNCWGKCINYKLFFRKEDIIVKFNLYFCNVNFNTSRIIDEKKHLE